MRCRPLTQTSQQLIDPLGRSRLVSTYEWRGHHIDVCDSALNVLKIIELFNGETEDANTQLFNLIFFNPMSVIVEVDTDIQELVQDLMWDVCGLDVTENGEHTEGSSERWFDWLEDADRIRNSFRIAYGLDWNEKADSMTFSEVLSLLQHLTEYGVETPFQQAVHYRTAKPPSAKQFGSEYLDAWYSRRDFYELHDGEGSGMAYQNDAMADMFAAAMKSATKEVE